MLRDLNGCDPKRFLTKCSVSCTAHSQQYVSESVLSDFKKSCKRVLDI